MQQFSIRYPRYLNMRLRGRIKTCKKRVRKRTPHCFQWGYLRL